MRAGKKFTSYTPARSFTIRPSGTTTAPDIGSVELSQYRKPVRKTKLRGEPIWIEKTKYALESPGERMGITMKGIAASKKARSPNYAKLLGMKSRRKRK